MSNGNQARAALQKFFPQRFTDLQWDMLAAQGYEQAILSRERTAESVAAELQAFMATVRAESAGSEPVGPESYPLEPRTWEDMEKWVLARALIAGGSGRATPAPGAGAAGGAVGVAPVRSAEVTGMTAHFNNGSEPPRRRWWLWAVAGVLVVAAIVVLLFVFVLGGKTAPTATTSPSSVAGLAAVDTTSSAVTTSTELPASTTSSTTTSTTILTTTTALDVTPTYVARLSGAESVPAVTSDATGTLTFTVAADGLSVDYVFEVSSLTDLTIARLRVGAQGAIGDGILTLYPGPTIAGAFSGVVAEGSFTAAQLLGPLQGQPSPTCRPSSGRARCI